MALSRVPEGECPDAVVLDQNSGSSQGYPQDHDRRPCAQITDRAVADGHDRRNTGGCRITPARLQNNGIVSGTSAIKASSVPTTVRGGPHRQGASRSMRMAASWSGSKRDPPSTRLWRDDTSPPSSGLASDRLRFDTYSDIKKSRRRIIRLETDC